MQDFPQKHYICVAGNVKKHAEAYREAHMRLYGKLITVAKSVGVTSIHYEPSMMLLISLYFKEAPPAGWTKKDKYGRSRPLPTLANKEMLTHFTPGGSHQITTHPELLAFQTWLGCPLSYNYKQGDTCSGWSTIGRLFSDGLLYWYSVTGPIVLVIPDMVAARKYAKENKQIVTDNVLDWKPPKGLKEILPEEWELMAAKHKQAQQKMKAKAKS
jgi:hypothetical protein